MADENKLNIKRRSSPDDVMCIDLTGDDHDDDKKPSATLESVRKRIKTESPFSSNDAVLPVYDEDIEVLEQNPDVMVPVAASLPADSDVQVVGTVNEQRLPHMRPHCTQFPHTQNVLKFCDKCYCYVCDIPASDCKHWDYHSQATDTGPRKNYWKSRRETEMRLKKKPRFSFTIVRNSGEYRAMAESSSRFGRFNRCRHCNSVFCTSSCSSSFAGTGDWCQDCGRVAREKDLGKEQSKPPILFDPEGQDLGFISLGQKTIPFRLATRDPRQMSKYKHTWTQNEGTPGWIYDEKDMQEELFLHRFGNRPTLKMIFYSMPVVEEGKLPKDIGESPNSSAGENEIESLIIEDAKHKLLLRSLYRATGGQSNYDLTASWDRASGTGTFELQVYVRPSANRGNDHIMAMLGAWFGIFPFSLTDLCGTLEPKKGPCYGHSTLPVPPFQWREEEIQPDLEESGDLEKLREAVDKQQMGSQTISPSVLGKGGHSSNENDFVGILRRFCKEILPYCVVNCDNFVPQEAIDSYGIVSHHRKMRGSRHGSFITARSETDGGPLEYCLSLRHHSVAHMYLQRSSDKLISDAMVPKDVIDQLENLGHAPLDNIDGLNVELLPFQKQTVRWATERETTPGGIQTFTWAKLPSVGTPNTDLYYNPGLRKFSTTKPALVRGGFCCEEMGLGKTVISLALILQNPAPMQPPSGSHVSSLATTAAATQGTAFWDPDLADRTQQQNKKRGSILSRGTLVVCTVSLVGQWIEEAKSKLKNPGLVYPYHGGGRKRNPLALARNSIVVTTYETLASDDSYHRERSNDPNYCPPCEQVRWWRIICDESHVLRNPSGKVNTTLNLVGDNKWLVTGTPVCTGVGDLKNQLKFLGLHDVASYVQNASKSSRRGRRHVPENEYQRKTRDYLFLLRPIMMRHSQQQTYSGTTTTLMSLPPKTERVVEVSMSTGDAEEYQKLEASARSAYLALKASSNKNVGSQYLAVSQLLLPLRVACAGGQTPLLEDCAQPSQEDDEFGVHDTGEDDGDDGNNKKRVVRFSEYAFTSKLNKLIEELERAREEDSSAKSLVFSQFGSTLKWLQEELPKRGFQYRTLDGSMPMKKRAKALHDFQNDPPTTIFLLSMRAGAVGINLTQANRVFLLEPCLNPALEMQAIGRVHRLGQKRNVEIIRLVVKDSVETRMTAMLKQKYGSNQSNVTGNENDNEDGSNEEEDGKEPASSGAPVAALVGSQISDRVGMVEAEFDGLFGIDGNTTADTSSAVDMDLGAGSVDDFDGDDSLPEI